MFISATTLQRIYYHTLPFYRWGGDWNLITKKSITGHMESSKKGIAVGKALLLGVGKCHAWVGLEEVSKFPQSWLILMPCILGQLEAGDRSIG